METHATASPAYIKPAVSCPQQLHGTSAVHPATTSDARGGGFRRCVPPQVYWDGGEECIRAAASWEQAAKSLDGLVKMGRVNFAHERTLAATLAPANAVMAALGYPAQVYGDEKVANREIGFALGDRRMAIE
jgi:hypothetical protein